MDKDILYPICRRLGPIFDDIHGTGSVVIENLLIKNININSTNHNSWESIFVRSTNSGGTINVLFKKVGIVGSLKTNLDSYNIWPASFVSKITTDGAGKNTTNFEECYARVEFSHIGTKSAAIFAGFARADSKSSSSTAKNCYWVGTVSPQREDARPFLSSSYSNFNVQNCYYDKQKFTIAQTNNGTGLTTAQMQTQASYVGWDFENTWYMGADGYPELKFEK